MATLTPTLTLSSTDIFADQPLNLSVTDSLTVQAPMTDISRMNTGDNIGHGEGVIIPESSTNEYFVYVKHAGVVSSDGTTAASATADFVLLGNHDGIEGLEIKLYPGEFAFFPLAEGDSSPGSGGDGGLKVTKATSGVEVQINYAYWKRS